MGKATFYKDIGKTVKDILTQDYDYKQKVKYSTSTETFSKVEPTASYKGGAVSGDVKVIMKPQDDVEVEAKLAGPTPKLDIKTIFKDVYGAKVTVSGDGLKMLMGGEVEAKYKTGDTAITAVTTISPAPKIDCAATKALGNDMIVGVEAGYDTAKGAVTKYGGVASIIYDGMVCNAIVTDKLDTLKVQVIHDYDRDTTIVGEVVRKMSKGTMTYTAGMEMKLDSAQMVKAKADLSGTVAAFYKNEVRKGMTFACSAEVNALKDVTSPKLGFSLSLK